MDANLDIEVNGIATPALYQGDWMLDEYCKLIARGYTKRGAYREAFAPPPDIPGSTLDSQIGSLYDRHPEIPQRIAAAVAELRAKWRVRIGDGAEKLWNFYNANIDNPKTAGAAMTAYRILVATIGGGVFATGADIPSDTGTGNLREIDTSTTKEKIAELMAEVGIEPKPQQPTEGEVVNAQ